MKKSLAALYILFTSIATHAQKDLDTGDIVSDDIYAYLNKKIPRFGTKEGYKGKNIVINFWSNYCHTCFLEMPEEYRLQKKFGDSIRLIMVTANTQAEVNELYKKRKSTRPPLDQIVSDTFLKKQFPHLGVPYLIWIDQKGTVRHITSGNKFNEANIRGFVTGGEVKMDYAKSPFETFNYEIPFIKNAGVADLLRYFSVSTGELVGVGGSIGRVSDSTGAGFVAMNTRVFDMYRYAYGGFPKGLFDADEQISIQVTDSGRLFQYYSYELKLPVDEKENWQKHMQADLDRFFGYEIKVDSTNGKKKLVIGDRQDRLNNVFLTKEN